MTATALQPRRYRPQMFSEVLGQATTVQTLKNALRRNQIAATYLFAGTRGTGKTTLARLLAKALNCVQRSAEQEPCNRCHSCTAIAAGHSLDVIEIDGASHRGIDDVRQITETVSYAAAHGAFKIYIIDEVHMLTKEAFNALLKTLEEPPAAVKFFLATTETQRVPETILSRCQRFDLQRISSDLIADKLKGIAKNNALAYEEDALQIICQRAAGSLRDAESMFDQISCLGEGTISTQLVTNCFGLLATEAFFRFDQAVHRQEHSFAFLLTGEVFTSGKDLSTFLEQLLQHYRYHLLYKLNHKQLASELDTQLFARYAQTASIYTQSQCLYILEYLTHWLQEFAKSPFKKILLEMILLHLLRSAERIEIGSLLQEITDLKQSIQSQTTLPEEPPWPAAMPETPPSPLQSPIQLPARQEATASIAPAVPTAPPVTTSAPAPTQRKTAAKTASATKPTIPTAPESPGTVATPAEHSLAATADPSPSHHRSWYDTLVHFTAVALEGSVKSIDSSEPDA